jgi:hypothetical protein
MTETTKPTQSMPIQTAKPIEIAETVAPATASDGGGR